MPLEFVVSVNDVFVGADIIYVYCNEYTNSYHENFYVCLYLFGQFYSRV